MNPAASRLAALTKELSLAWQQTRESWKDQKAQEFEQKYLRDLWGSVEKTLVVMEQLEKVIAKIRKDCE